MDEGLNLNLMLNGATLLSVMGLGVKVYLAGKAHKLEQPIEIRQAMGSTAKDMCDERHKTLDSQTNNLFSRLSSAEQRISKLEATITEVKEQYKSIDNKLTTLLGRK